MVRNKTQNRKTQRLTPAKRKIQKRPRRLKRMILTLMVILMHGAMDLARERSQQLVASKPSQM